MKKNNSEETFFVHRLVAEAFVPNPNKFKFVAHKDGDLTNNNADNLEWVESGGDEDLLKEPVGPTFTPGEDFDDEMEDFAWHYAPVVITFTDGTMLVPQSDDEGNDGGALFYYNKKEKKQEVIPVIY